MKRILFITLSIGLLLQTKAQEVSDTISPTEEPDYEIIENDEEVTIIYDDEPELDTTSFTIGNREITIVDENGETSVRIRDKEGELLYEDDIENFIPEDDEPDDNDAPKNKGKKFKGHWSAFEFGLNNYLTPDMSLIPDDQYMELNTGKSWNFNLNFAQYSFGIINNRFGVVTGMGLEWNNYSFYNQNTIEKLNGQIASKPLDYTPDKNKLRTTYLTVPLLLEAQLLKGKRKKRIYVATGVIGGLKINSKTKVMDKPSKKNDGYKDDYYLSPFRYGVTGRIGYKAVKLYCNYSLTPLFQEGKGPELYPVSLGITLDFN